MDGSGPGRGYNARALRPAPIRTRRARVATATFCVLMAALLGSPAAFAGILAPESEGGSPNAEKIQTLYMIAFAIGILIFLLVEGVLIYSLVKFRWRRGGDAARPDPRQHAARGGLDDRRGVDPRGAHGRHVHIPRRDQEPARLEPRRLRRGAEARAATAHGKLQFASLNQSAPPGPPNTHLNIKVNGQQFLWRYDYPDQGRRSSATSTCTCRSTRR